MPTSLPAFSPVPRTSVSTSLFRWLAHKQKVLRAILAAFVRFHSTKLFKRLDILDGESGLEQKKRQRQREAAADERRRKERSGDNGSHAWRAFNRGFNAAAIFLQSVKNTLFPTVQSLKGKKIDSTDLFAENICLLSYFARAGAVSVGRGHFLPTLNAPFRASCSATWWPRRPLLPTHANTRRPASSPLRHTATRAENCGAARAEGIVTHWTGLRRG